jgi:hypothetical protein
MLPRFKSSHPDYFSRIVALWPFLGFLRRSIAESSFPNYGPNRHNFFRRKNVTSSNPVACLGKAKPAGIFFGRYVEFPSGRSTG